MTLIKWPSAENILLAAKNLKAGALIGLPTETVYGLAADAENENAVKRIYAVKGRPKNHPLIVHIGSIAFLEKWVKDIPEYALILAKTFWPGPMTLILKKTEMARDFVTGGQESIGIRIPSNTVAIDVLSKFHELGGKGLAAPSANKFGAVSPTSSNDVEEELGEALNKQVDLILDGGPSIIGIESTIINCLGDEPHILRYGSILESELKSVVNLEKSLKNEHKVRFSGNNNSHYSPKASVVVNEKPLTGDGFIALNSIPTPTGCIRLAQPRNIYEYARELYSAFRMADRINLKRILVVPPIGNELEVAINERIAKAAYKK